LFTRNYESPEQINALTHAIKQERDVLICVDHEGGRVQRFRSGFTRLPACRKLGHRYDKNPAEALQLATEMGWLMAAELRAVGVDFSFAPVLDLDYGVSGVIGDRAFHSRAAIVTELARAYTEGMAQAGMACVGKHFPGHGGVTEDSHVALPVDRRELSEIEPSDMIPFQQLTAEKRLHGIMPAHVIYEKVDSQPAGFSRKWIQHVLREQYAYDGVVFSDDLNMAAAIVAGSFTERAYAALNAGCDVALVCNNRAGAVEVLQHMQWPRTKMKQYRLERMRGAANPKNLKKLQQAARWKQAQEAAAMLINDDSATTA
jgi:beta-N-acetylhexosaminidase